MDSTGAPGMAVAVARQGRIIWEQGFGWADREKRLPATEHTLFSLASISKPITATGLMRLVEEGKVSLDEPANRYLGSGRLTGLAGDADQATVRRVLSHTAGLPLHYRFYYADEPDPELTMDEAIARYAILVYPPGESYQYSNLGYGIVDHIIARVSQTAYADYMRTRVFAPLGLTRMAVHLDSALQPYAAARYDSRLRPIPFYDFDHDGGSAVWASAHDLVRFGMFHLKERLADQQRILADSTIDLMQREAGTPEWRYGLGWIVADEFGYRRVAHSGGMPGVSTLLVLYPARRLAIVVLANKAATPVTRVAQAIAGAVLPALGDSLRAHPAAAGQPAEAREPFTPPAELLGAWSGWVRTWSDTVPLTLVFQEDGDVHVALGDQLRALLNQVRFTDGALTGRFAGTIPTPDASPHPHQVLLQLRLRDGRLTGQASAQTPEERVYFALTSYVELTREREP
jgi:CubicO group peptidase (beta-lactamase class C family)